MLYEYKKAEFVEKVEDLLRSELRPDEDSTEHASLRAHILAWAKRESIGIHTRKVHVAQVQLPDPACPTCGKE